MLISFVDEGSLSVASEDQSRTFSSKVYSSDVSSTLCLTPKAPLITASVLLDNICLHTLCKVLKKPQGSD